MKMKKKLIIAIVLLIVVSISLFKYYAKSVVPTADAVWIEARTVKESTLPFEAHAIGTLVARSNVEITPEVAGHVEKIYFQDGAYVEKGAPLIQLNDAVFKAQLQSARAQLAYSENDFKRKSLLGKQGAIARQAIDQADADLKERKAIAQEKEVMLNKMKLTAPFAGVVGKSKVNLGDYVTIGQSVVMLTDTRHLRFEYNVAEKYLPLLKLGQVVKITSSAYPGKIFTGKVSFISPTINSTNRSVSLYADVANDDNLLAPGMFVNAVQSLGSDERALMIPARSIVPILDGEQVYKVVEGKAYPVTVTIGKRTPDEVQVVGGLTAGDVVITDGQLKVKNGMSVKIKT